MSFPDDTEASLVAERIMSLEAEGRDIGNMRSYWRSLVEGSQPRPMLVYVAPKIEKSEPAR